MAQVRQIFVFSEIRDRVEGTYCLVWSTVLMSLPFS